MRDTTETFLAATLLLGKCFGLIPLQRGTESKLRLNFKSVGFLYSALCSLLLGLNVLFYISSLIAQNKFHFGDFVTLLFFSCSVITFYLFLKLAQEWPSIVDFWNKIDFMMDTQYGTPSHFGRSLNVTSITVIFTATLEHCLFIAFVLANFITNSDHDTSILREYFINNFRHIFIFLPYSPVIGVVSQCVNFYCTFYWNYMDLFIMIVSIALSERFSQVKRRVEKSVIKQISEIDTWREIREDYNRLSCLSKILDDSLGYIVLLSFANNLFVILVQLLHSLESEPGASIISRLYFVYSFGFLILRTLAVTLFASRIYSESSEPADVLNQIPSEIYNEEIERLILHIKMDPSFLSGKGFFKVRKSLLLSIAGAIVSYELIFIQFHLH